MIYKNCVVKSAQISEQNGYFMIVVEHPDLPLNERYDNHTIAVFYDLEKEAVFINQLKNVNRGDLLNIFLKGNSYKVLFENDNKVENNELKKWHERFLSLNSFLNKEFKNEIITFSDKIHIMSQVWKD